MRDRARDEKCSPEITEFQKSAKDNGVLLPFENKQPTDKMKECLAQWFLNEDFKNECTQIYLDERSEYRRTGIPKKWMPQMAAEQREFNA